ncbi:hypothetical protein [Streptomyces avermitilis]|uniref:hypothetical protein n=1 Tax=Streptomyces avermitilis TaxID=33903 RepID=UPI0033C085E1
MLLYHFTDRGQWPQILGSGAIDATWRRWEAAPPIVNLTEDADPQSLPWALRERRIRIMVDVPDAESHAWVPWAEAHGIPSEERWSLLADSDPSRTNQPNQWNGNPSAWFVVERPIPRAEWKEAIDLDTAACLWPPRPTT